MKEGWGVITAKVVAAFRASHGTDNSGNGTLEGKANKDKVIGEGVKAEFNSPIKPG